MENAILSKIRGGLIVSCQALENEPLHSSYIMQRMAVAAMRGGAVGIRANTVEDILKIREEVNLPLIGIIKRKYKDSDVMITPTMSEIDELMEVKPDILAMDGTDRIRPGGEILEDFFGKVREKYPEQLFMADCSTLTEGVRAAKMGFDIIGTTLRGYTSYTKDAVLPDIDLMRSMVKNTGKPVIAEGGIWTPEQLGRVIRTGVWAAVIGTAITRPKDITEKFVKVLTT
ncbi:N-acetylmannosamine-6-phosphate 2-epimerase [Ruminococcus sp. CLA-AA-H200]|uniref:Putative N-acetylmannosamine-6-phosphate 2-epimerase n=1 Tax=Ruminococcus turbiniformis TaxID=2881258 RepID=A0ABS8G1Q7_9FIRM|nr:N-acetylmannosamine-6-phosphate 2-epimerase [Ruminococcus turbiniformis]MCC2256257.1 N-acetylmannosamine-6-phosphate 2-epimerase [Ruminococcus turbiniformis]